MTTKTQIAKTKTAHIKLLKPDAKHKATEEQKEKRVGFIMKIRTGFLRLIQTLCSITSVIIIVYLTATVLLPTIGGALSKSIGLTGQTHFYNMLQGYGFPMLCITGMVIIGDFYLCKYTVKKFRDFFQSKIDVKQDID